MFPEFEVRAPPTILGRVSPTQALDFQGVPGIRTGARDPPLHLKLPGIPFPERLDRPYGPILQGRGSAYLQVERGLAARAAGRQAAEVWKAVGGVRRFSGAVVDVIKELCLHCPSASSSPSLWALQHARPSFNRNGSFPSHGEYYHI